MTGDTRFNGELRRDLRALLDEDTIQGKQVLNVAMKHLPTNPDNFHFFTEGAILSGILLNFESFLERKGYNPIPRRDSPLIPDYQRA